MLVSAQSPRTSSFMFAQDCYFIFFCSLSVPLFLHLWLPFCSSRMYKCTWCVVFFFSFLHVARSSNSQDGRKDQGEKRVDDDCCLVVALIQRGERFMTPEILILPRKLERLCFTKKPKKLSTRTTDLTTLSLHKNTHVYQYDLTKKY